MPSLKKKNVQKKLLVGSLGFEPRLPTPQAGILDQARLRPHDASLGSSFEGKITSTLIRLKVSGLARSTLEHIS